MDRKAAGRYRFSRRAALARADGEAVRPTFLWRGSKNLNRTRLFPIAGRIPSSPTIH